MYSKYSNAKEKQRLNALKYYKLNEIDIDLSYFLESLTKICEVPLCNIVVVYQENLVVLASAGIEIKKNHKRNQ